MGQGGVGKTAMVLRYTTGDFNEQVRAPYRLWLPPSMLPGFAVPLRGCGPFAGLPRRGAPTAAAAAAAAPAAAAAAATAAANATAVAACPAATRLPFPPCPVPLQYMPTIGDMYTKDVEVFGAPRHIEIDDTAGQVRPGRRAADSLDERKSTPG